jgi:adenine-specific DNA-methyltransferase
MLLEEPAVLVQRTTSPEQQRRLVCVDLTPEKLQEWGGRIVAENHVNVLRPEQPARSPLNRSALSALLSTRTIDRLLRCISGSVAVSAYELESLPLPDLNTLRNWNNLRGDDLEQAVAATYQPDH